MTRDFLWLHLRDLPYFRATLRAVEARLMQNVDLSAPVLDLGSGDGHFASVTFEQPLDVGIDPDARATREALGHKGHRVLALAHGAHLPHPSGYFASAISNSVLEHVDRLDEVLMELRRVLRSDARFVFTVPNTGYSRELSLSKTLSRLGLRPLGEAYNDWFMRMSRTKNLFDENEWIEKLAQAGFAVELTQRYFSPAALRMLEWGHYFGGPCLLPRVLTGRWILAPTRWNLWLTERLVRRYYLESPSDDGTYTFYVARKQ
jgi:SAM-dependent methyltransferase